MKTLELDPRFKWKVDDSTRTAVLFLSIQRGATTATPDGSNTRVLRDWGLDLHFPSHFLPGAWALSARRLLVQPNFLSRGRLAVMSVSTANLR